MAQFATGADLATHYDRRRLGQLLDDTGAAVPPASVADHPVVTAMLVAASDEVVAACGVGARYAESDLTALAAESGGGGPLLRMLVCHLAYGLLINRRGLAADDQSRLTPMWKWSQDYLTLLRKGERVFGGVPDVPEAGLPDTFSMAPAQPGNQPPSIVQTAFRVFGTGPVVNRGLPGYR